MVAGLDTSLVICGCSATDFNHVSVSMSPNFIDGIALLAISPIFAIVVCASCTAVVVVGGGVVCTVATTFPAATLGPAVVGVCVAAIVAVFLLAVCAANIAFALASCAALFCAAFL